MRKTWILALTVPAAAAAGLLLWQKTIQAADHLDAPGAMADPAADINDVYVFRSQDPGAGATDRTVFVMTVSPLADTNSRFSDKVDYEFRIQEIGGSGSFTIKCNANSATPQVITCVAPGAVSKSVEFNVIDAGDAANDDIRIFAGLRDDPFFFDLAEFQQVVADPTKVSLLTDNTGTDFLGGKNVLALVVDVKNSVFGSATQLKVHGATNRTAL